MITPVDSLSRLRESIAPDRARLEQHPIYLEIRDLRQLRLFLESHVFAVWDFMSLLKGLQAHLTCVATPWLPSRFPQSRRLINEIVLGEESDTFRGGYLSHFEIYLQAMHEAGADASAMHRVLEELANGRTLEEALAAGQPPAEALAFVRRTFSFLNPRQPHVTAAAFTFGREDLIPDMFHQMVRDLGRQDDSVKLFVYYLDRHIAVDGESHGPMALQMLEELCGDDDGKWEEASRAARQAINARLELWDGILARIEQRKSCA